MHTDRPPPDPATVADLTDPEPVSSDPDITGATLTWKGELSGLLSDGAGAVDSADGPFIGLVSGRITEPDIGWAFRYGSDPLVAMLRQRRQMQYRGHVQGTVFWWYPEGDFRVNAPQLPFDRFTRFDSGHIGTLAGFPMIPKQQFVAASHSADFSHQWGHLFYLGSVHACRDAKGDWTPRSDAIFWATMQRVVSELRLPLRALPRPIIDRKWGIGVDGLGDSIDDLDPTKIRRVGMPVYAEGFPDFRNWPTLKPYVVASTDSADANRPLVHALSHHPWLSAGHGFCGTLMHLKRLSASLGWHFIYYLNVLREARAPMRLIIRTETDAAEATAADLHNLRRWNQVHGRPLSVHLN